MSEARDLLRDVARTAAAAAGPCPAPEDIVAFYRTALDGGRAAVTREHLASCPRCIEVARDARAFLDAMGEPAAAPIESGSLRGRRYWILAAGLILAVGVAGWAWWSRGQADPLHGVALVRADYPLEPAADDGVVWRGEPTDDTFADAMVAYEASDYGKAESKLRLYLREHPGDEHANLYRGVSLLLLDRAGEAVAPLQRASTGDGPVGREARWYLARAHLASGAREAALEDLRLLATTPGRRQAEAGDLLGRLSGQ